MPFLDRVQARHGVYIGPTIFRTEPNYIFWPCLAGMSHVYMYVWHICTDWHFVYPSRYLYDYNGKPLHQTNYVTLNIGRCILWTSVFYHHSSELLNIVCYSTTCISLLYPPAP